MGEEPEKDSCCARWTPILWLVGLSITAILLVFSIPQAFGKADDLASAATKVTAQDTLSLVLVLPAMYFLYKACSLTGLERLEQIKYAGFVSAAVSAVRVIYFWLYLNYHDRAVYLAKAMQIFQAEAMQIAIPTAPPMKIIVDPIEMGWKIHGYLHGI